MIMARKILTKLKEFRNFWIETQIAYYEPFVEAGVNPE